MTVEINAWKMWACSATVLGGNFLIATAVLTALDVWNPEWWQKRALKSTVRPPVVTLRRVAGMLPVIARNVVASALYVWALWTVSLYLAPPPPSFAPNAAVVGSDEANPERTSAVLAAVEWIRSEISWLKGRVISCVFGLAELALIHAISQLWFWTAHRLVHANAHVFRYVHAAHHVHSEPFALTAIDCSVSEMLLLNIPAVVLPLLILRPSLAVQCIWMTLAAWHVTLTHSGHHIKIFNTAAADAYHAIHHRELRYNYGSTLLDRLTGAYKEEN